jgi:hypothetical protein
MPDVGRVGNGNTGPSFLSLCPELPQVPKTIGQEVVENEGVEARPFVKTQAFVRKSEEDNLEKEYAWTNHC